MTVIEFPTSARAAAELRRNFDQSFQALAGDVESFEDLLAITVGAAPYALRVSEISGLFADRKITRLPTLAVDLLGIAGFRGTILPVYDLGMLLGCERVAMPRWLVVTAAAPVALAFERFDGHLRPPPDAIVPAVNAAVPERHVREVVRTDVVRPVIHLPSVVESIRNRRGHGSDAGRR